MSDNTLSSIEEKRVQFMEHGHLEHWLFVDELRKLLNDAHLKPDDWLECNSIGNIAIFRKEDGDPIGVINTHDASIEWFGGDAE